MARDGFLALWFLAGLILAGPVLAQPAVSGTILTPDNRPLAKAQVALLPVLPVSGQEGRDVRASGEPPPVTVTETDATGRFSLQAPDAGLWRLIVRSPGTVSLQSRPLPLVEPLELPPAVLAAGSGTLLPGKTGDRSDLWLAALGGAGGEERRTFQRITLSGRVVEESGKPVPGALVWTFADPGSFVRTDGEGHFRIPVLLRRQIGVAVLAAGYLEKKVIVPGARLASERGRNWVLTRASRLQGKVMDLQGRPLAGVAVAALPQAGLGKRAFDPADPVTERAITDPQGHFDLRRLRPGESYAVRASRAGSFPVEQRVTAVDGAARPRQLTLVLAPARSARGRVRDPEGRPVAGAEVVLRPALRPASSSVPSPAEPAAGEQATARSDGEGTFLVAESPATEVELAVRKQGFASVLLPALRIPAGSGPADLGVVILRPGADLAGRVMAGDQAVHGAEVFVLDRPVRTYQVDPVLQGRKPAASTGADGRFVIADLAPGTPVHLVVRAAGYLTNPVRAVRPPTAGPLLVRLEPAAILEGQVLDEEGEPVAGAHIDLRWQAFLDSDPELAVGEPVLRNARAGADGRFELREIPAGTARVSVAAAGFISLQGVEVELPRPAAAGDLRLVLRRGAVLQGRVTTTTGEPVAAARVGVGGATATTDDEGAYWLDGAEPGRRDVFFFHPSHGRLVKPFDVQPGVNVLDVSFASGQEVSGRVIDESGKPVAGSRVELISENRFEPRQYQDVTGEDGLFRLSPVTDGRYRLKAGAEGFPESELPAAVEVAGEAMDGLEIALRRGAVISGSILGLPEEDLTGVKVVALGEDGATVAAWTDGRGRYEARPLRPGNWVVRAVLWEEQRQAQVRVQVAPSDRELERDIEFGERLTLSALVLYEEEPLPDAQVSLRSQHFAGERTTVTDYKGSFQVDDLEPDTYLLGLSHAAKLLVHSDQVELRSDREIVIRLQPSAVGGVVVSEAGKPVAGALVFLRPVAGPELQITVGSKDDGRFAMARVPPGRYRLEAVAPGFTPAEQEVQVAAGEAQENLEVRLAPAEGAKLRVRLSSGQIPQLVHVVVHDQAGATVFAESLWPDRTGEIELSTLSTGAWKVFVGAEGGALTAASLTVPSETVSLTLPPAGKLQVRVPSLATSDLLATLRLLGPGQKPFWTLGLGGKIEQQWSLVGGGAIVNGLPAGHWVLEVETPDGQRRTATATTIGGGAAMVTVE